MKRTVIGVVTVIILVAAIAVIRTLLVPKPEAPTQATPAIAVDARAVAQHLGAAVRFRTVSYGGGVREAEKDAALAQFRDWMVKTYPDFNKVAKREIIGQSVVYTWPGKNAALKPILLMAHMDVVPVVPGTERSWGHAPFSGDVAGGYVWGRGAIDDKGSLVMILEAAERLANAGVAPERTIMFAFGQDEEVGGTEGNGVIAKTLAARGIISFSSSMKAAPSSTNRSRASRSRLRSSPWKRRAISVSNSWRTAKAAFLAAHARHGDRAPRGCRAQGRRSSLLVGAGRCAAREARGDRALCAVSAAPAARQPLADRTDRRRFIARDPEGEARLHTTIAPTMISGRREGQCPAAGSARDDQFPSASARHDRERHRACAQGDRRSQGRRHRAQRNAGRGFEPSPTSTASRTNISSRRFRVRSTAFPSRPT